MDNTNHHQHHSATTGRQRQRQPAVVNRSSRPQSCLNQQISSNSSNSSSGSGLAAGKLVTGPVQPASAPTTPVNSTLNRHQQTVARQQQLYRSNQQLLPTTGVKSNRSSSLFVADQEATSQQSVVVVDHQPQVTTTTAAAVALLQQQSNQISYNQQQLATTRNNNISQQQVMMPSYPPPYAATVSGSRSLEALTSLSHANQLSADTGTIPAASRPHNNQNNNTNNMFPIHANNYLPVASATLHRHHNQHHLNQAINHLNHHHFHQAAALQAHQASINNQQQQLHQTATDQQQPQQAAVQSNQNHHHQHHHHHQQQQQQLHHYPVSIAQQVAAHHQAAAAALAASVASVAASVHHHPLHHQLHQQMQQQMHHHHHHQLSNKQKSCLTCADISVKWYIVVIALLGLMSALIGTILGAVHSAGRDYISLALLLVGVGLVLVSISGIAWRITIKTYKSNNNRSSTSSQANITQQHQHLSSSTASLMSPPSVSMLGVGHHIAPLHANLHHLPPQHRAAAAAALFASHHHRSNAGYFSQLPSAGAVPAAPSGGALYTINQPQQQQVTAANVTSTQQPSRVPHESLPTTTTADAAAPANCQAAPADAGTSDTPGTQRDNTSMTMAPTVPSFDSLDHHLHFFNQQSNNSNNANTANTANTAGTIRSSPQLGSSGSRLNVAKFRQLLTRFRSFVSGGSGTGSSNCQSNQSAAAAAAATATAISQLMSTTSTSTNNVNHHLMQQPSPLQLLHAQAVHAAAANHPLIGPYLAPLPAPPNGLFNPEFHFRPPPPSYHASMQEYRLRLLLFDRANANVGTAPSTAVNIGTIGTHTSHTMQNAATNSNSIATHTGGAGEALPSSGPLLPPNNCQTHHQSTIQTNQSVNVVSDSMQPQSLLKQPLPTRTPTPQPNHQQQAIGDTQSANNSSDTHSNQLTTTSSTAHSNCDTLDNDGNKRSANETVSHCISKQQSTNSDGEKALQTNKDIVCLSAGGGEPNHMSDHITSSVKSVDIHHQTTTTDSLNDNNHTIKRMNNKQIVTITSASQESTLDIGTTITHSTISDNNDIYGTVPAATPAADQRLGGLPPLPPLTTRKTKSLDTNLLKSTIKVGGCDSSDSSNQLIEIDLRDKSAPVGPICSPPPTYRRALVSKIAGQNIYNQSPSTSTDSLCGAIKRVSSSNPLSASSSHSLLLDQQQQDDKGSALSDLSQERISLDCIHNGLFISSSNNIAVENVIKCSSPSEEKASRLPRSYTLERSRRVSLKSQRNTNSSHIDDTTNNFVSSIEVDEQHHNNSNNSNKRSHISSDNDNNINRVNIVQAYPTSEDLASIGSLNKLINVVNVSSNPESLNSYNTIGPDRQHDINIAVSRNHISNHHRKSLKSEPHDCVVDNSSRQMYQQVVVVDHHSNNNIAKDNNLLKVNSNQIDCELTHPQQQQRHHHHHHHRQSQQQSSESKVMTYFGDQSSSNSFGGHVSNCEQAYSAATSNTRSGATNAKKKSGNNSEVNILAYV